MTHQLLKQLSDERKEKRTLRGDDVNSKLEFSSLLDLLTPSDNNALISASLEANIKPTSHRELINFLKDNHLGTFGLKSGDRVGVAIPLGPELVVGLLLTMTYCTCAPINPNSTEEEISFELHSMKAKAVIVLNDSGNEHILKAASNLNVKVLLLQPSTSSCGLFKLVPNTPEEEDLISFERHPFTSRQDVALVLHTSGTTGTKKLVPILLEDLCVGGFLIAASIELNTTDICLNMMPLFHVGGILRNIVAPLIAGGAVVCMPGVDPSLFWELCKTKHCTWYYAAPTIHMALIEEAKRRGNVEHSIRLIANAAGGLLPTVAEDLKRTFNATILPSYGMTECMPIACPPVDYKLEKPGSSGLVVGPEVAIMDNEGNVLPAGTAGNIMIRGRPVMRGYENNAKANSEAFNANGWFNTGDLGYLDSDGYLYITGRSKEVINRGGEIISPFEIEDVVITHPAVKEVVAFSVPHDKLQESIGIAVVLKQDAKRMGIKSLHRFIGSRLQPPKWPQLIVFMDNLAKTSTNKAQRVGLATRMKIGETTDQIPESQRLFEATCAGGTQQIPCKLVQINLEEVDTLLTSALGLVSKTVYHNNKMITVVEEKPGIPSKEDILKCVEKSYLPEYLIPDLVILIASIPAGGIDFSALVPAPSKLNPMEKDILDMMAQTLDVPANSITPDSDFFELGGNSIAAGQLVGKIRKEFNVPLPTTAVFSRRTVTELSSQIAEMLQSNKRRSRRQSMALQMEETEYREDIDTSPPLEPHSQTGFFAMFVQMLPFVFLFPLRRGMIWFFFMNVLALMNMYLPSETPERRLTALILALILTKLARKIFFPILFIFLKWIFMFKYRAGRYRLWGCYYLRWWLMDQLWKLTGPGIFKYSNTALVCYYRLLGASIGNNVQIDPSTTLGEFDLIHIGDNVKIEKDCLFRPFTAESGTMILQAIWIGSDVVIGEKAAIAPGAIIGSRSVISPLSSSYEAKDVGKKNPKPPEEFQPNLATLLFVGYPIVLLVHVITLLPALGVLYMMGTAPWRQPVHNWVDEIEWFVLDLRIMVYLSLRPIYKIVCPLIRLTLGILCKWIIIGKFYPGPIKNNQWTKLKYWLVPRLLGNGRFFGVLDIVGSHYELVSVIYRLLGSKIGKHVYWPGSGIPVIEYDLFSVQDFVVFGSRSRIKFNHDNRATRVIFKKGANIADRCYIMPGVVVGEGAVLGSGTFAPTNTRFMPKSVWVGSNNGTPECLFKGQSHIPEANPSPFAEAFYNGKAPYPVIPLWAIIIINFFWMVFVSMYKAFPVIGSLLFVYYCYPDWKNDLWVLFGVYLAVFVMIQLGSSTLALLIDIAAKWMLLGRRKPGNYGWNENSYCQRWQLYLMVQQISTRGTYKNGLLRFFQGSVYLVWYFRALGCTIGKDVCLYPTGGDPMMTEPDLVTIEDKVAINNASVIGHINSRGSFTLNTIHLGEGATLRSYSRLLSGAEMGSYSKLMEHTLVMGGDRVSESSILQGWPAKIVGKVEKRKLRSKNSLKFVTVQ